MRASKRRRNQHEPVRPLARLDFAEIEHRLLGEGTGVEFKTAHYGDVFKAGQLLLPAAFWIDGKYLFGTSPIARFIKPGILSDDTRWFTDDPITDILALQRKLS